VQYFRPNPGQGAAFQALLRSDVLPAWQKAKQAGHIAGAGVATTAQGMPGLYIIWVHYPNLAALDRGNMLQETMGATTYSLFLLRVAHMGHVEAARVTGAGGPPDQGFAVGAAGGSALT
jgi:hypothetical protein